MERDNKIYFFFRCVELKAVQCEGVTFGATNWGGLSWLGHGNIG